MGWWSTRAALAEYVTANYDQPNPHNQTTMASPPTITATTSALAPTSLSLSSSTDLQKVLIEGGSQALVGTVFQRPIAATGSASVTVNVASRLSVSANSDEFYFYVLGTTLPYRFLVDDVYVDTTGTVPAATSGTGTNWIKLAFGSKTARKVTIECQQNCGVRFIGVRSGDTFDSRPAAKARRGIVLGDSITAATGATAFGDGYVQVAGDTLGIELWPSGVGGTGFVNTNSGTRYKLSERLAADLQAVLNAGAVDVIVVAMGINDVGLSGVEAEAAACFATIRQMFPAAQVLVVGPWDASAPTAPSSSYTTTKGQIQAAMAGRGGFYFLDPEGVGYTKSDSTHPDTAGHQTLGDWLALQIKTALGA